MKSPIMRNNTPILRDYNGQVPFFNHLPAISQALACYKITQIEPKQLRTLA